MVWLREMSSDVRRRAGDLLGWLLSIWSGLLIDSDDLLSPRLPVSTSDHDILRFEDADSRSGRESTSSVRGKPEMANPSGSRPSCSVRKRLIEVGFVSSEMGISTPLMMNVLCVIMPSIMASLTGSCYTSVSLFLVEHTDHSREDQARHPRCP